MYPTSQAPFAYPVGPAARGNGPGLAALIIGVAAMVTALTPFVNVLTFLIGPVGIIVGIVGLALADRPRRMAAWGLILSAVGMILAFVMIVVIPFGFIFAMGGVVDQVEPPASIESSPFAPEPVAPVGDVLPLGTVVVLEDSAGDAVYEATMSASVLDADGLVAAVPGNPEAPADTQWAMATIDVTVLSDSSFSPATDLTVGYVASDGTVISRYDAFAQAPEPQFDNLFDLAVGESVSGNVVIAIPSDRPADGVWSLHFGYANDDQHYFEVE
jgi:hypothetical protein